MELKELEDLKNLNELDLLHKIIDVSKSIERTTEKTIKGNKNAGKEVRNVMQDIRLIAEEIRFRIQKRKGLKENEQIVYKSANIENTPLNKAIVNKKISISKEDLRIEVLERERKKRRL